MEGQINDGTMKALQGNALVVTNTPQRHSCRFDSQLEHDFSMGFHQEPITKETRRDFACDMRMLGHHDM